ncbi:mediator of RNA polymerase II transcription subunit 23 [Dorcoceras hygrometricum]|uniref:Mediator of RNA polymerase II transcription subunit 23 n=1 Tax=Dorcoceras hygrometricum TaxID=472368 RepID=A0A2Z7D7C7_9LAMI|nr:mediator of RNA polymerase II transcription subunit 23 [Dorcoceras hygrometricum]
MACEPCASSLLPRIRACIVAHSWGCGLVSWDRLNLGVVQPVGLRPWWPEQGGRTVRKAVVAWGGGVHGSRVCVVFDPVQLDRFDGFGWTGSIENAEPLGSLGLNGAGDDPLDFIPTGGEDL